MLTRILAFVVQWAGGSASYEPSPRGCDARVGPTWPWCSTSARRARERISRGGMVCAPVASSEEIADPGSGQNKPGPLRVWLDLPPHTADIQPHVLRLVAVLGPPDRGQQLLRQHHPTGVASQVDEQSILGWSQSNNLARAADLTAREVDAELPAPQHWFGGRRVGEARTAQRGAYARE